MIHTRKDEGSTLLLVLAMLSIVFLIGAALSFSTRLENQASSNYAQAIQARMSVITGLPAAVPMIIPASQGLTSTLQSWAVEPAQWNKSSQQSRTATVSRTAGSKTASAARSLTSVASNATAAPQRPSDSGNMLEGSQVLLTISDLSGRVNLNSIRKEESLAKIIDGVLPGGSGNSRAKAHELFRLRGGEKVSTDAARLDLREKGATGEGRLSSLASLRQKKGRNAPLFTEDELRTLSNYLTVFSESPEVYNADDGSSLPKIALKSASVDETYQALQKAFPTKEDSLLMQFAANIADFGDADDLPTLMNTSAQPNKPWLTIFGSEQTPLITEVYPDAATPVTDGDFGQFVEISNPWSKPLPLTGWRLSVGGATGMVLNQVLPPGGTLIITDNYDQPADSSRPGTGSFLSIFGARKDDFLKKVQVETSLKLPDRDSYVALFDASNNLVDAFAYGSAGQLDTKVSLQREDPRLRVSRQSDATPFQLSSTPGADLNKLRTAWQKGNQPLGSAADLFQVSTAYVTLNATGTQSALPPITNGHPWQMPELKLTPGSAEGSRTNLDLRLVDIFTNLEPRPVTTPEVELTSNRRGNRGGNAKGRAASAARQRNRGSNGQPTSIPEGAQAPETSATLAYAFGKLNLNTCAKVALHGLDIKLGSGTWQTGDSVDKFEAFRLKKVQENKPPFTNVSDFLAEFFPTITAADLPALADLLDQVTVGSSAFEITAQNRVAPDENVDSRDNTGRTPERLTRRPATAKARWVISMDQQPYSLVQFTTVP